MEVYIGYVGADYAQAILMSRDRKKIEKKLAEMGNPDTWIVGYDLGDGMVELDCN